MERCGCDDGGGERAEPALWANGKEVGEAWVSSVRAAVIREVTHGPPPSPPLCPSLKFLISFQTRRRLCHSGTTKGVSRR